MDTSMEERRTPADQNAIRAIRVAYATVCSATKDNEGPQYCSSKDYDDAIDHLLAALKCIRKDRW